MKIREILLIFMLISFAYGQTIVKEEVKTYQLKLMCECGGEFKSTGIVLTSNPPQYPHACNSCGKQITKWECYPYIKNEKKNENR